MCTKRFHIWNEIMNGVQCVICVEQKADILIAMQTKTKTKAD